MSILKHTQKLDTDTRIVSLTSLGQCAKCRELLEALNGTRTYKFRYDWHAPTGDELPMLCTPGSIHDARVSAAHSGSFSE